MPSNDYDRGRQDGYHGVSVLVGGPKSESYLIGWTIGRKQYEAEHRGSFHFRYQTNGMNNGGVGRQYKSGIQQ